MGLQNNEELQYRTPFYMNEADQPTSRDVEEFSTLSSVRDDFKNEMEGLFTNFMSFDIKGDAPKGEKLEALSDDIRARQLAYAMLDPLFQKLASAVEDVERHRKGE